MEILQSICMDIVADRPLSIMIAWETQHRQPRFKSLPEGGVVEAGWMNIIGKADAATSLEDVDLP